MVFICHSSTTGQVISQKSEVPYKIGKTFTFYCIELRWPHLNLYQCTFQHSFVKPDLQSQCRQPNSASVHLLLLSVLFFCPFVLVKYRMQHFKRLSMFSLCSHWGWNSFSCVRFLMLGVKSNSDCFLHQGFCKLCLLLTPGEHFKWLHKFE